MIQRMIRRVAVMAIPRGLLIFFALWLTLVGDTVPWTANAQERGAPYMFGAITGGFGSDDAGLLGLRVGYGQAWEHLAVEGQLAYATAFADGGLADGGLLVPSLSAKYVFGDRDDIVRLNLGGGVDFITIIDSGLPVFGFPWAHAMTGADIKLASDTDFYFEARTYGLISLAHIGLRYRF